MRLATAFGAVAAAGLAGAAGAGAAWQIAAAAAVALVVALLVPVAAGHAPRREDRATAPEGDGLGPGVGRLALDRLPDPVLVVDGAGRIAHANPAAHALFERIRPGEHYSMSFRSPDFLDALEATLEHGGRRSFDFSLHGDRTRQIEVHVEGPPPPRRPGDAPPEGHVVCLFRDRTHETRLARMRTDFVANASHELRTPLSSVKGFIETLIGPARDDEAARERFLGIMLAQTERMARLIDDLLSLSRIELNEHIAPSEVQDLGHLARETAEAMAPVAEARGAALEIDLPQAGPLVRGDRDQLAQAIGNLLENALKYGDGAPVGLSLRPASPDHPAMVGLAISDRGAGIAREHLPRLTERFYRVSAKRSRDAGGTGLGLAIVKHILTRHRGELQVESTLGEGSRFTLWLPETRAREAPAPKPQPTDSA